MRLLIHASNLSLGVEDGVIVAPEGRFDAEVCVPGGDLLPGLINAHDHLHRNHYGRLGRPPYRNAYDWAFDIQRRFQDRVIGGRALPRRQALLEGAWKNLFAGVTSVVHHDPWESDFDDDFPIRVVPIPSEDSPGMSPSLDDLPDAGRFCLHLAEGCDEAAAEEVRWLQARGRLSSDLIAVHGVGIDRDGAERLARADAALVWCPSSNLYLFDRTAPDDVLDGGVDVLLGSDSLLTADGDLLDELRLARRLGPLDDARLHDAVGPLAAERLGIAAPTLAQGAPADLIVLTRPLLEAGAEDVALVVVDGAPRVALPNLAGALAGFDDAPDKMTRGSVTRWASGARRPDPDRRSMQ